MRRVVKKGRKRGQTPPQLNTALMPLLLLLVGINLSRLLELEGQEEAR